MAKIEAFAAVHYNPAVVEDISKVVCPPYDVINPAQQELYYQKSPYNIIRLILGKDFSSDTPSENKYTRAAAYLEDWVRRSVFIQDTASCIYFYEQTFEIAQKRKRRLGFIALMRLDDDVSGRKVHPHEHTHTAPKEDRLKLIASVEANLSPIFTVFSDEAGEVKTLFNEHVRPKSPLFEALEENGTQNRIWRLQEPLLVDRIKALQEDRDVFIADGHHRYEVARTFRDQKRKQDPLAFRESYNYCMAFFTPLEDEGLCILPTHRLLKNSKFANASLESCFSVKEMPTQESLFSEMRHRRDDVGIFGLYKEKRFYLLRLDDKRGCNRYIQDGPKEYKNLDVVILQKVIFDNLIKVSLSQIHYEVDAPAAIAQVDAGNYDALFLLNPTRMEQIRTIALGGEVMPQKSTYFYPKLLSGFLIHKF